jgi:hypothetical protein
MTDRRKTLGGDIRAITSDLLAQNSHGQANIQANSTMRHSSVASNTSNIMEDGSSATQAINYSTARGASARNNQAGGGINSGNWRAPSAVAICGRNAGADIIVYPGEKRPIPIMSAPPVNSSGLSRSLAPRQAATSFGGAGTRYDPYYISAAPNSDPDLGATTPTRSATQNPAAGPAFGANSSGAYIVAPGRSYGSAYENNPPANYGAAPARQDDGQTTALARINNETAMGADIYAYCLDRGNGQYTRLIPADMLPRLRDVPVFETDATRMQVLPTPQGLAPNGRNTNVEPVTLQVSLC